jgi:hypothetical protein
MPVGGESDFLQTDNPLPLSPTWAPDCLPSEKEASFLRASDCLPAATSTDAELGPAADALQEVVTAACQQFGSRCG